MIRFCWRYGVVCWKWLEGAVFILYSFFVNTATGEKSGEMLAVAKFTASESNGD